MKNSLLLLMVLLSVAIFAPKSNAMAERSIELAPVDKNVQLKATLRQARFLMDKRNDYEGALKLLKKALKLSPNNSEALKLQQKCNSRIAEKIKAEKDAYKTACEVGTKSALERFISSYPNSTYRKDAENRIADYGLWNSALEANTKSAFQSYLSNSKYLSFKDEANKKIRAFEAEEDWEKCKDSKDDAVFDDYRNKYPDSPHATEAKWKSFVLSGEKYYTQGYKDLAYFYLNEANELNSLSGEALSHYKELKEEKEYKDLLSSYDIYKVRSFLNSLSPSSKYYNPISNRLSYLLAREITKDSPDYSMKEALSYARDAATKEQVNRYIHSAKQERTRYRRQMRTYAHKRWWRENFSWGLDADFGTNINSESGSDMYWSIGPVARFGTYEHLFNMTIGVKYRAFMVSPPFDIDESTSWKMHGGAVAIPANFRFNVARISSRSKMFIGSGVEFGIKVNENSDYKGSLNSTYVSVFPKLGITSPYFDISVYLKTYIGGPFIKEARDAFDEYKSSLLYGLEMAVFF